MSKFDLTPYIFPIVSGSPQRSPEPNGPTFMVDRFLGSGFWVDTHGHFLTCRHVLQALKPGQCPAIGQPFGDRRDRYIPIIKSSSHPRLDIAVGTVKRRSPSQYLMPYENELIVPGLGVSAFG